MAKLPDIYWRKCVEFSYTSRATAQYSFGVTYLGKHQMRTVAADEREC